MLTKEQQREAACKAAETAVRDIQADYPELTDVTYETYDITELPSGDLLVNIGQDVKFFIDTNGDKQYLI